METLRSLTEELVEYSELIADAILKKTAPVKDDITERQARQSYGAKWLKRMRDEGLDEYHRVGNRVIFSRHQLDCLRAAERQHSRLIYKGRIV